jgi:hypothetical protein
MNVVKLIAVFGENKLGHLAALTKALADTQVNIRWITIVASSEKIGVIKILVDRVEVGVHALRQAGFTVSQFDILAVEVADKPGGLHAVADCLAKHSINVENSSGFVSVAHKRAVLLFETKDLAAAAEALKKGGMRLLTQEQAVAI